MFSLQLDFADTTWAKNTFKYNIMEARGKTVESIALTKTLDWLLLVKGLKKKG